MKGTRNLLCALVGIWLGFVFVRAEVISWFRIQEMFRFQSFHMYGIIGSAVMVGAIGYHLLRRFVRHNLSGEAILIEPKAYSRGTIAGGLLFGVGWAFTGACPGPLYTLAGSGYGVMLIPLIAAIFGAWFYGVIRSRLPH
ncbi:MAG: YeeE/YedE family protein [Spirochaetales bacterium]|nr:YeeE/YedE family protein [Leptospiraceae bacterium]MCP5483141.1 YeeE/YedE family protein [Spirochaetales bacterium]MCP5484581.1 YeeE/YedE family protein [Spirochaetales bacterium]